MRKIFFLFILSAFLTKGQNLVPNPSFDDTVHCPTAPNQINLCQYWSNPTQGSPDYFNACDQTVWGQNVPYTGFGFQMARTGNSFIGLYAFIKGMTNAREYVQTKLNDTLISGTKYLVSFYANLSDNSQYSISTLGMYFSPNPISSSNYLVLNYNPQIKNKASIQLSDSVNWMLIQDTLTATGNELYLTIGNFNDDSQSDTSYIGWFSSNNIAYYYIDDVSVMAIDGLGINAQSKASLRVYPNPASEFLIVESGDIRGKVSVIDLLGNNVMQKSFDLKEKLDISALPVGIYFLKLECEKGVFSQKFSKD